jgi:hypothetical protein
MLLRQPRPRMPDIHRFGGQLTSDAVGPGLQLVERTTVSTRVHIRRWRLQGTDEPLKQAGRSDHLASSWSGGIA